MRCCVHFGLGLTYLNERWVRCLIILRFASQLRYSLFVFLMIRRPPRSTLDRSSAASDVYKRQNQAGCPQKPQARWRRLVTTRNRPATKAASVSVSYTHLRAHETVLDLVCRLLLEKKNNSKTQTVSSCMNSAIFV